MLHQLEIKPIQDALVEGVYKKAINDLNKFFEFNWAVNLPQIIIVNDRKTIDFLHRKETPQWLEGWSTREYNRVFILNRKNLEKESSHKYSKEDYSALIQHELSHQFYSAVTKGNGMPVWLNEGIAAYTSGQTKLRKDKLERFSNFLEFYDKSGKEIYAEAGFAVRVLIEKFGRSKLVKLVKSLERGMPKNVFESNFKKIYGFKPNYKTFNGL